MSSYWYSTNGLHQRRLSDSHLRILDKAYEQHRCVEFFDQELSSHVLANPCQGTMTAGDLHYGLYRQPPLWRMSDMSLDTLILMDTTDSLLEKEESITKYTRKTRSSKEENYLCCIIS